jgi:putative (di)nucleoside polyphosphate hydrolase
MDRKPLTDSQSGGVFRAGVGLVVLDERGRVLALERSDIPGAWQLPQGGLDPGEESETAAWRELKEETGLGREHVVLKEASDFWIGYELPQKMRSIKTRRGQVHKWFVFELRRDADLPLLPVGKTAEFVDRRWITFDELVAAAIDFRRPVYALVARFVNHSFR